ncbi:alpha/beta fold hydrolase [Rhodococcus sp. ARC_M6]|uniref:alpha/beta fold hydrolase n=1 Tax=Rhodococcus sp. ARC_M6 TaxID=2928852 RepID=UPI001FB29BC9|nr:alpha/beta hydrolase [Rhodococcus sp. ARC_M6]MCJ0903305.1 alpha/beta hydrolase [Rhodococcus sp. ARC_M6]
MGTLGKPDASTVDEESGVQADDDLRSGVADSTPPRLWRMLFRVAGWIFVGLISVVVVAVVISATVHWWQTPRDREAIEQLIGPEHRYVDVNGHRMSVAVQGSGSRTIVLMPGLATPEPILSFGPLARRLAEQNTVVTVEPFGLGLSDGTDTPRTSEAIVDETRAALGELGLSGPYVLMPHSISGLYAMWWTTHHPDEVAAVVGLDDERYTSDSAQGSPDWPSWMAGVSAVGGIRDLIALDKSTDYLELVADYRESLGDAAQYTSDQQDLYLRAYSWVLNPTALDEIARGAENVRGAEGTVFPSTLPALSILAASSLAVEPEWEPSHRSAISNPAIQQVTIMDGHHYLFHAHAAAIAEMAQQFLDEYVPAQ